MVKNKQEGILNFLRCASILEERTYVLYKELADRVELPLVSSLLYQIAYDSQKHSAILRGIGESIGGPRKQQIDCEKKLGGVLTTIDALVSEISKEKKLTKERLPSLIEKLTILESTIGEEYYVLVQLKTLEFMTNEIRELYDVNLEDMKGILETIISDEEVHSDLLSKLKKMLAGEQEQTKDKSPTVKYTNPDAWSRPVPDSVYESAV